MEQPSVQDEPIERSIKIILESIENIVSFFLHNSTSTSWSRENFVKTDGERRNWRIIRRNA